MKDFVFPEGTFVQIPLRWITDLKGEDLRRMALLHFRFKYFAEQAFAEGKDVRKCYFESQQALCGLFGMSDTSRSKVSLFLQKMEKKGYLTIDRGFVIEYGVKKPRHYITVSDPLLLSRYKIG